MISPYPVFRLPGGRALANVQLMSTSSCWLGSLFALAAGFFSVCGAGAQDSALLDIERRVSHGFATNNGVRIHYAALGQGPLIVMIHGFPDCWLTWRQVMDALAKDYETVAIDQRGYNLSDKPKGVEHYDMAALVEDVAAVVRARGRERAIIAGHDWGGAVAWSFAMQRPEMTEKLIILNLPHPRGIAARAGAESAAAEGQRLRAALSAGGRAHEFDGGRAGVLGDGGQGKGALCRSVSAVRFRGDAELLQAQLSARTLRRRSVAGGEGEVSGADDSRLEGHRLAVAGIERQLGFCGEGFHAGHDPGRRSFCAARCAGAGDAQHPFVAGALRGLGWRSASNVAHLLFLDLYLTKVEGDNLKVNAWASISLVPAHLLLKVEQIDPALKLAAINPDWMQTYLKQHPNAIAHRVVSDSNIVLAANTDELQKFVLAHFDDKEFFADAMEMKRK